MQTYKHGGSKVSWPSKGERHGVSVCSTACLVECSTGCGKYCYGYLSSLVSDPSTLLASSISFYINGSGVGSKP